MKTRKQVGRPNSIISDQQRLTFAGRLGDVIQKRRTALNLGIVEASILTDGVVSVSCWSSYEHGTEPRLSKFLALCRALGVKPEEMVRQAEQVHGNAR